MQKNCSFCMTILNCWYGTTVLSIDKSVGVSFHTNTSAALAVANASAVVCFKDMQLFKVTLHQNSKLDSLRLGLTFQIGNPLSCKKVWKVDLWNIYKNKLSQDLCSTVTVNKHSIINHKSYCCFWKIYFWQWAIEYSAVLILTSLTWYFILYFLFIVHHL